jgi:peptide chain release factor 1
MKIIDILHSDLRGIKYVSFLVEGDESYKYLRFEGGTHRVQRVPITEASGRIHTSAATIAVLPDIEDKELELKREDLKIETFRAGGPGGQHVNKTDSAVRITHIPTGITASCQADRSQHRNRDLALRILRAKLYEFHAKQKLSKIANLRKSQIGSGDRSEKIRTYNYPQNRVTDHRINYTIYALNKFLDGNMDELLQKLIQHERENTSSRSKQS